MGHAPPSDVELQRARQTKLGVATQSFDPSTSPLWLVINLDRAKKRWNTIRQQCNALNIKVQRVSAVDGRELTVGSLPRLEGVDFTKFRRNTARSLRGGDVGCYMSHLQAIERFLRTDAEFAVILEDDAILSADCVAVVAALTEKDAPRDWDMVKLAAEHRLNAFKLRPVVGRYHLAVNYTRQTSAVMYVLNRHAATLYRQKLLPMVVPYDFAFDRGWALGLRTRVIAPLAAGYGLHPSQIETAATPKVKSRRIHSITRVWWELRNEAARLRYASAAKLRRMRGIA